MGRLGLALTAFALCGSCSRRFEIIASGYATNVRLAFVEGGLFSRHTMAACVFSLTVTEEQWPNRHSIGAVWGIKAKGEECVTITGVDVGHVPDGFSVAVNRLPLQPGKMYGVDADARPYGGFSAAWVVCQQAPKALDWKDAYNLEAPPEDCRRPSIASSAPGQAGRASNQDPARS